VAKEIQCPVYLMRQKDMPSIVVAEQHDKKALPSGTGKGFFVV
jgi:hypothetical protein